MLCYSICQHEILYIRSMHAELLKLAPYIGGFKTSYTSPETIHKLPFHPTFASGTSYIKSINLSLIKKVEH